MKALGIILAGGNSTRMKSLSDKRAISAMPVGCSYRAIDFASRADCFSLHRRSLLTTAGGTEALLTLCGRI